MSSNLTASARHGAWCNWQHIGFWHRRSGFESLRPSQEKCLALGLLLHATPLQTYGAVGQGFAGP